MFSCSFCHNERANSYVYMECQHVVCVSCASLRYNTSVLVCCGKVTNLEENTIEELKNKNKTILRTLSTPNYAPKVETSEKQPIDEKPLFEREKSVVQEEKTQRQQSIGRRGRDQKVQEKDLEEILKIQIERVKGEFEEQHKLLREKEKSVIEQIFMVYENQMRSMGYGVEKLSKIKENTQTNCSSSKQIQESQITPKSSSLLSQSKPYDIILKKLELNQQRMDEKLHKHL